MIRDSLSVTLEFTIRIDVKLIEELWKSFEE
jgi:hypothetical protein